MAFFGCICVFYVCSIVIYAMMIHKSYNRADYWEFLHRQQPKEPQGISQLEKEWNIFYVDIVTVDADSVCPATHKAPFLYDLWPGIVRSAICSESNGQQTQYFDLENYDWQETYENFDFSTKWRSDDCMSVYPSDSVTQDKIMGVKFCARTQVKAWRNQPIEGDSLNTWAK